jgi:hypothetical protein
MEPFVSCRGNCNQGRFLCTTPDLCQQDRRKHGSLQIATLMRFLALAVMCAFIYWALK